MTIDTRSLADFTSIKLEGHGDLVLEHGDTPAVTIDTDPETMEHLKIEVENGRLTLGMKSWLDYLFHSWAPVHYRVTYRELDSLAISGSCKVRAETITADRFELKVSGSGSVLIAKLTTQDLQVHISGSGEMDLSGSAHRQDIRITGSGKLEGWALESETADVHISGSGDLMLKVSEKLSVSISGSGSVRYIGAPQVSQSISGSGAVRKVG